MQRHFVMNLLRISIIISFMAVSQTTGNGSECEQSDKSILYLEVASEMIAKAKLHYPTSSIITPNNASTSIDCADILRNGFNKSGVYTIWPKSRVTDDKPLDVFCDMDTDGGGWTVLQRRGNFSRPNDFFFKDWDSYKNGFGDIDKDFWLGNDNIFALTNQRLYSVRFDLTILDDEKKYAIYDTFWIEDETNKYTMRLKSYTGDAGNSMVPDHMNRKFTTKDQDNDGSSDVNCGQKYKGGWWYGSCHATNLNGLYVRGKHDKQGSGMYWSGLESKSESVTATEIKIRPKHFKNI